MADFTLKTIQMQIPMGIYAKLKDFKNVHELPNLQSCILTILSEYFQNEREAMLAEGIELLDED